MDASQPSRYLVLLWLQGLRRVVRCKCYQISLARPGRSWRKASSRDLRIAFYIGSSSPATCGKNMFASTQEATHAKSWNIMKIKWREWTIMKYHESPEKSSLIRSPRFRAGRLYETFWNSQQSPQGGKGWLCKRVISWDAVPRSLPKCIGDPFLSFSQQLPYAFVQ